MYTGLKIKFNNVHKNWRWNSRGPAGRRKKNHRFPECRYGV